MHGEAADKPRYSFNFRVGEGKKKRRGGRKKWKRRAHKKGKCSTEGEVEGGAVANECTVILKTSFVNVFPPCIHTLLLYEKRKKFFISSPHYILIF